MVTSVQASMISDGYFYYYTSFLDADYAKMVILHHFIYVE